MRSVVPRSVKSFRRRIQLAIPLMRGDFDQVRAMLEPASVGIPADLGASTEELKQACTAAEQPAQTLSGENAAPDASLSPVALSPVALQIVPRIVRSLQRARETAEAAVINVCNEVTRLVGLSQTGNEQARSALHALVGDDTDKANPNQRESISDVIHTQAESMNEFVEETRGFFHQQINVANNASIACKEMHQCAAQIVKLVFSSEILAFNIQIESARLGDSGRTFSVLGDEMARFSAKVRDANSLVQRSLTTVGDCMAKFQEESKAMEARLTTFAHSLNHKMDEVNQQTLALTESIQTTLDQIAFRNDEALGCLQRAFSELQFQDPMAQDLVRTEHDVLKLQHFIETGIYDDSPLNNAAIGSYTEHNLEAGSVQLF